MKLRKNCKFHTRKREKNEFFESYRAGGLLYNENMSITKMIIDNDGQITIHDIGKKIQDNKISEHNASVGGKELFKE